MEVKKELKQEEKTENFIEDKRIASKTGLGGMYSYSKLWLYENCPEYYRLKYIDKKLPDLPRSMPPFLGNMVHESLEWLYFQIKNREVGINDLIEDYTERWINNFTEDIVISKGDAASNFNKGVKFLIDYYMKHKPFEENVVSIEQKVVFPLDKEGHYKMQGYIDRLDLDKDGVYEIHDYKTGAFLRRQDDLNKDKQLAYYHLGLKHSFGKEIKAILVWHFLAHNVNVKSQRTDEQLEELRKETLELIYKIENTTEWTSCGKKWCDWCNYKKEMETTYEEVVNDLNKEEVKIDKNQKNLFN